jgi:ABC-type molybdate transport system ATPase subunit
MTLTSPTSTGISCSCTSDHRQDAILLDTGGGVATLVLDGGRESYGDHRGAGARAYLQEPQAHGRGGPGVDLTVGEGEIVGFLGHITRLRSDLGTTVFLTTHYLEEADVLCDRVFIIDHGVIAAEGTPDELKRRISGDVVALRVAGGEHGAAAARKLLADQALVREISTADGSLKLTVERGEQALPTLLRVLDAADVTLESINLPPDPARLSPRAAAACSRGSDRRPCDRG